VSGDLRAGDAKARSKTRRTLLEAGTLAGASALPFPEGDPDFVLSLARGLQVIEAFHEQREGLTVSESAARTGLSRAAARRLLITLESLGYAERRGSSFHLTSRVLRLGFSFVSSNALATLAPPVLEQLSARIHESCSVSLLDGEQIVYIARSAPKRVMTIDLGVGSRLPAYCTSIGRLLLASQPQPAIEAYFANAELRPRTLQTKVSRTELEAAFARAREQDYVVVDEELEPGVRAIAVPVRAGDTTPVAAISVSVRAETMSEAELVRRMLQPMREAAASIGRQVTR